VQQVLQVLAQLAIDLGVDYGVIKHCSDDENGSLGVDYSKYEPLYGKLNENMDHFLEVLLGKTEKRTELTSHKSLKLIDLSSHEEFKREINGFKGYLVGLNNNKAMQQMSNTDLYNIRDEILGDLNQFLYLFTFK
jgi:hypothetical protein